MSGHGGEGDVAATLRAKVEAIEEANRKAGYRVPDGALICLRYPEARALLDRVTPPASTDTTGGAE